MEPFGLVMPIGLEVGRRLTTWASTVQKCDVQPLSAMANVLLVLGGPIGKVELQEAAVLSMLGDAAGNCAIGSHPRQVHQGAHISGL